MNLEHQILNKIKDSIGEAIARALSSYNSPLVRLTDDVVKSHEGQIKKMMNDSFKGLLDNGEFEKAVKNAYNHKLAKILVSKLEGLTEKSVNELRRDPTLKAKMLLAVESILTQG